MTEAAVLEAMLLHWGETATGRTVKFLLPDDPGEHPFKGLKCGSANGQRVALSFALIDDDETQREPDRPAAECAAAQPEADAIAAEARGTDPHHYSRQSGMWCGKKAFKDFLLERYANTVNAIQHETDDWPAETVRYILDVKSRREFDTDPEAARRWRGLLAEFDLWDGKV